MDKLSVDKLSVQCHRHCPRALHSQLRLKQSLLFCILVSKITHHDFVLQKIKQVPVLHFTLIQSKVFVVAFLQVNSVRILMSATMRGLETAPD